MSNDKHRVAVGFRRDNRYGTDHLIAWPAILVHADDRSLRFLRSYVSSYDEKLDLESLQLDCFASDTNGQIVDVGWVTYRQPYDVDIARAKRMVKTLESASRAYQRHEPVDFGDKVRCLALWLKAEIIVEQINHPGRNVELDVHSIPNGIYSLRQAYARNGGRSQGQAGLEGCLMQTLATAIVVALLGPLIVICLFW
ncbi:MAG: hypothetical protein RJA36_1419 [Pseudomonadota bacterium]|jgi:hypothetical protein